MKYLEFDLEKALAGEPIAFYTFNPKYSKKGFLHKSKIPGSDLFFIEAANDDLIVVDVRLNGTDCAILGMWKDHASFEHWYILDSDVVAIKKVSRSVWTALDEDDLEFDLPLRAAYFPDCPVGTIIKR